MKSSSLNAVYRVVWNAAKGVWQAVSEMGKSCGKGKKFRAIKLLNNSVLLVSVAVAPAAAMAQGLPTQGAVVAGQATISQSANHMTVQQTSDRAAIEWQSFNVGQGKKVDFVQPNANAVALNRVLGSDVSVIQGQINANGQVFFVNPNGILFTPSAQVNTSGLVASTQNISTADFMAGKYTFKGNSDAAVTNQGALNAAPGGTVALIAAKIVNSGTITADKGNVLMGAGKTVVLDLGGPVKIEVKEGALNAAIEQSGGIRANGGLVYLTAKAAGDLASTVINHTGITQAQTLSTGEKGEIYLMGGMENDAIHVGGTLDASAPQQGDGGFIETSAAKVKLDKAPTVTTKSKHGKTGTWLIDPNDYTVAATGGDITGTQLGSNLASNNVTISTRNQGTAGGNGDIFVKDNVSWSSGNSLTLNAERNIKITATVDASQGNGGKVILNYGQGATAANNTATYDFGLSNAGFAGKINLKEGQNFSTKLGNDGSTVDYTVITSLGTQSDVGLIPLLLTVPSLQGMAAASNLAGKFVLGADIDASDTSNWNSRAGFTPIGSNQSNFTGTFDGLGHVISNLTINRPSAVGVGLFGYASGSTLSNIGIENGSVTGQVYTGVLAGYSSSSVYNAYAKTPVFSSVQATGGLIGYGSSLKVINSFATGNVTGGTTINSSATGGLIGSSSNLTVINSYATGNVSSFLNVGGLVGQAQISNISQSYSTGNVISAYNAGGLVGSLSSSTLNQSYATGNVSASNGSAGGLIGYSSSAVINAYASGNVTGTSSSGAIGGLIGTNTSPVYNAYATGVVSGGSYRGGLIGDNNGAPAAIKSLYDTNTTGQSNAVGRGISNGITGLTTAQMQDPATFTNAGWNIAGIGGAYPTLTLGSSATTWQIGSLATPVTYTLSAQTGTYKAGAYDLSDLWSTGSIFGDTYSSWVLGTDYNFSYGGNTVTSFTNAGTYNNIGINILKTGFAAASNGNTLGSLTIDKAILTSVTGITASNKTYDGSTAATLNLNNAQFSGLLGSDSVNLSSASGAFANANAGIQKTVTISNLVLGGNSADNYQFNNGYTASTTATIDPKALTISGSIVANKTYDGTTSATVTTGTLNGLVGSETLGTTSATGTFADKNASNGKNVDVAYTLTDGASGLASNYSLPNETLTADITPAALTVVSNDFVSSNGTTPTVASQTGCVDAATCVSNLTLNNGNLSLTFANDQLASNYTTNLVIPGASGTQLTVARDIAFNGFNLTLRSDKDINIRSTIDATRGNGDKVTLEYGQEAVANGNTASYNFDLTNTGFTGKLNLNEGQNFSTKLGSDGTVTNYTVITRLGTASDATTPSLYNITSLQGMAERSNLAGKFVLGANIDASDTSNWNGGAGFMPVGHVYQFTGVLDGLGHTVSHLTINRPTSANVGLVGTSYDGIVRNFGLTEAVISGLNGTGGIAGSLASLTQSYMTGTVTGSERVGGLVGSADVINQSYATGSVTGTGNYVGGLVGIAYIAINQSYATGSVTGTDYVGGLAGSTGTISQSYATGSVTGRARLGGLAGIANSAINQSYATGSVTGIASQMGGLVGIAKSAINQSYATGNVTGNASVGGLVGDASSAVSQSYATGDVTGNTLLVGGLAGIARGAVDLSYATGDVTGTTRVGGLIGEASSTVSQSYTTGDVTGNDSLVGGLAGIAFGAIDQSYATGNVTGRNYAGGLAGYTTSAISQSYATGDVTGNARVGGLVGEALGAVSQSYATGDVTGNDSLVGGLAGIVRGAVDRSYATGDVAGNRDVGGLIGYATNNISQSYATGNVSITGTPPNGAVSAGGLVGEMSSQTAAILINDVYATGNVTAAQSGGVGGLIGVVTSNPSFQHSLTRAYATGAVMGNSAGGLVGSVSNDNALTITNSFWDTQTTGQNTSAGIGALGKTTAEMKNPFTFINAGWDFSNTWGKSSGGANNGYMLLRNFATGLYDDYVQIGNASKTYGDANSLIRGATVTGIGSANVNVTWGSAITGATNAGTYNYSSPNVLGVSNSISGRSTYVDTSSGQLSIGRKSVLLTADSAQKTYDGSTAYNAQASDLQALSQQLVNGDSVTAASMSFNDKNAGQGKTLTLNSVTLSDGNGGNNYDITLAGNQTSSIAQAALTVRAIAVTRTYDGTLAATGAGSVGTLVRGDSISNAGSQAFLDKNAGANKTVRASGVTIKDATNADMTANYAITYVDNNTARIVSKEVTVAEASAQDKTYDGTTSASVTAGALTGLVGSETLSASAIGTFSDKNAGQNKTVNTTTTLADGENGGLASNYSLSNANGSTTATIERKTLTVAEATAQDKMYDGTTSATVTAGTLTGLVGSETLSASAVGSFNDKNAGENKTVTTTTTLSDGSNGGLASNYTLTNANGSTTATITRKTLTIAEATAQDKTYDGTTSASVTAGALTGLVGSETLSASAIGAFNDKNAGQNKTVATSTSLADGENGGLASNYVLSNANGSTTATIERKTLTVSGISAQDKTYDGSASATVIGGTLSGGFVGSETLNLATVGTFSDKNAGQNKTVNTTTTLADGENGGLASNYVLNNANGSATATIERKTLTVAEATAQDKTYDGTTSASVTAGALTGLVGSETLSASAVGTFSDKNAGENKTVATSTTLANGENGGLASNYVLSNANGSTTATIERKTLTVAEATAQDKTYDGTTSATVTAGALTGLVGSETLSASAIGAFNDKNAGQNKTVATSTTLADGENGGLASNYTLSNANGTTTATIERKTLTVAEASAQDKTYDGTTSASVTAGALSGLVGEETLSASAIGSFNDKNAGENKTVNTSTSLADGENGGLASNYTLSNANGSTTATIERKTLTVAEASALDKTYDGSTSAIVTAGALTGLVGSETLSASAVGSFNDKNAGENKTVNTSTSLADGENGGLASNYSLSNANGSTTATIERKTLTVAEATAQDKTYDGTTSATVTAGALTGLVGSETLSASAVGMFSDKNAGENKTVTTSTTLANGENGGLASNYTLSNANGSTTATIERKTLTVAEASAQDKTYDGTTSASVTAGALTGLVGSETLSASAVGAFSDKNAGQNKTVATSTTLADGENGGLASNYTLSNANGSTTATIERKTLTVAEATAQDKTYDGTTSASVTAGALTGLVGSETLSASAVGSFNDKNAGENKTVNTSTSLADGENGGLASNYTLSNANGSTTATIERKTLTVAEANAQDKTYDGTTSARVTAGALTGLVGSETLSASAVGAFSDKNAGENKTVATSTTLADGENGGLASNYSLSNANGSTTATIERKTLTVAEASAQDKTYDGTTSASVTAGALTGLIGSETLSASAVGSFNDKNAGENKTVATSTSLADGENGGLASNYVLSNVNGSTTATIERKALSVAEATAQDKTYDGTTSATVTAGALSGLVGSETLSASAIGAFNDKNAGENKTVATSTTLANGENGGLASNYVLSNANGSTTATIERKTLTVAEASALDKTYDGSTSAIVTAGALTGLVGSETLSASAIGAFNDKNAGENKTVATSTTLADGENGGLASNYSLSNANGSTTATIERKTLTVAEASAQDKTYDGTTSASVTAGALTGLVGEETLSASAVGAFSDKNAGQNKTVATSTTLADGENGGLASNYSLSNANGSTTATIERKTLTVAEATAQDKTYDGTTSASVTAGALSGLVGEETLSASAIGSFNDKNAGENKTVATSTTLADGENGGLASNYVLSNANGSTTATIERKTLTVAEASAQDKTYDGTTSANVTAGALSGLVGEETLSASAIGAFSDENAGENKTVATSTTLADGENGGLASNYVLSNPTGSTTASILSAPTTAPDNTAIQGVISQATQVLALQGAGRHLQAQQVGGGMTILTAPVVAPTNTTSSGGVTFLTTDTQTTDGGTTTNAPVLRAGGVDASGFVQVSVLEGGINLTPSTTQTESEQ